MTAYDKIYIGGAWVPVAGTGTIDVIDSITEEVMATIPAGNAADVDQAVKAARAAFETWSATSKEERAKYLTRIGEALGARMDELATTISRETGMVKAMSKIIQVGLPINSFNSAATLAETSSTRSRSATQPRRARADRCRRLHHAVELPAAPDRGQGRLRHGRRLHRGAQARRRSPRSTRSCSPRSSTRSGLPAGVFNLVSGDGPSVGEAIAAHPGVDMVSFTGSTRAGRRVAAVAAETIKKVALELGGKSANIIGDDLDDDDLRQGRGRRHRQVLRQLGPDLLGPHPHAGAPLEAGPGRGRRRRHRREVHRGQPVRRRRQARPVGLGRPARPGAGLHQRRHRGRRQARGRWPRCARGPGDGLLRAAHRVLRGHPRHAHRPRGDLRPGAVDPALRHRSRTPSASPTTPTTACRAACGSATSSKAKAVARRIRTGQIEINGGKFNPNAPFGGYKQSGIGREYGRHGFEEFLETKAMQL